MTYLAEPFAPMWENGVFTVPRVIVQRYIKLASAYQLKALLLLLESGGACSDSDIARTLGLPGADVQAIMEFWIEEGVVRLQGSERAADRSPAQETEETKTPDLPKAEPAVQTAEAPKEAAPEAAKPESEPKKKFEKIAPPELSPKEVVEALRSSKTLQILTAEAQKSLGRPLSPSDTKSLILMVNYYGLQPEIVLMILSYCEKERNNGRATGVAYLLKMAENWAEEGIATIEDAERKLSEIEQDDQLWKQICTWLDIAYRRPTAAQKKSVDAWRKTFTPQMIELACAETRENATSPSYGYLRSILNNWQKNGVKTAQDVQRSKDDHEKKKAPQKNAKNKGVGFAPSYDLDKIKDAVRKNTDIF